MVEIGWCCKSLVGARVLVDEAVWRRIWASFLRVKMVPRFEVKGGMVMSTFLGALGLDGGFGFAACGHAKKRGKVGYESKTLK